MKPLCSCGREASYQQITGWVALGKRDSVTLREDVQPPQFKCRACVRLRQLGVPVGQGSLA